MGIVGRVVVSTATGMSVCVALLAAANAPSSVDLDIRPASPSAATEIPSDCWKFDTSGDHPWPKSVIVSTSDGTKRVHKTRTVNYFLEHLSDPTLAAFCAN